MAKALGCFATDLRMEQVEILDVRRELRLRFNAPTQVDCWTLALAVASPDGLMFDGEAELFYWLSDDEWELVELAAKG